MLLLDNCTAHEELSSNDGKIVTMMLPPNVTAVIQPMDQNPIKITKLKYRNSLLANVVAQEEVSVHDALKNHSIRDAILLLKSAWDNVSPNVLEKAWSKILNWDDKDFDGEDDIPLSELIASKSVYDETIAETQMLLSKLGIDCSLTIEEIEDWNADMVEDESECDMESGDESDHAQPEETRIQYEEALNAVNTLIKWTGKDMEQSNKHLSNLLTLRTDIVKQHFSKPQKQTKLDQFFSR